MTTWYYLYIDDPQEAMATSDKFIPAFDALDLVGGSNDAAVFSRFDVKTGGVHYYFTPQAQPVALAFGATPCPKPSRQDAGTPYISAVGLIDRLYPQTKL